MKVIFLSIVVLASSTLGFRISKGEMILESMPEDQKSTLARSFQTLCLFKPSDDLAVTMDWTSDLKNSILSQGSAPTDSDADVFIRRVFIDRIVDEVAAKCNNKGVYKRPKQNEDIYEGVGDILTNVFSGNLFGVIQSSIGIRTPEGLSGLLGNAMRQFLETLENARDSIGSQANRLVGQGGGGNRAPGAGGARVPSAGGASGAANALGGAAGAGQATQVAGTGTQLSGVATNPQATGANYIQGAQQQQQAVSGANALYQQGFQQGFQQAQHVQGVQQGVQGVNYNQVLQQQQIQQAQLAQNAQQANSNVKVYQITV